MGRVVERSVRPRRARAAAARPDRRRGHGQRPGLGVRRAGRPDRGRRRRVRHGGRSAARDRAHPRAARPAGRRGRAARGRPAAGRLAGQRHHPAARGRRAGAHDPPLPPRGLHAGRPRRGRDVVGAAARAARRGGPRAAERPRQRRHRLGQDDDAQRAVVVHPRRRADRHGRGRRGAAPAAGARRPPRGAARVAGGPRRGDRPPAGAQRAADAARPDHRRRGPRAGGARHALRDVQRPRRLAVDRARRLAGGGAAPRRDARAHGRRRACRTRRCATRSPARWTSSSTSPGCPTAAAGSLSVVEVVRVAGGPGTRELYALRDGRPTWRAPQGDGVAARLRDAA